MASWVRFSDWCSEHSLQLADFKNATFWLDGSATYIASHWKRTIRRYQHRFQHTARLNYPLPHFHQTHKTISLTSKVYYSVDNLVIHRTKLIFKGLMIFPYNIDIISFSILLTNLESKFSSSTVMVDVLYHLTAQYSMVSRLLSGSLTIIWLTTGVRYLETQSLAWCWFLFY